MDTKKLRQKILDLAIHGKLVPQDPNDEPASVLLDRIRKEKEQLIKEGKIKAPKKSKSAGDTSHYPKEVPWELPEGWVWLSGEDIFLPMESTSPKGEFFDYIDIDAIDNATNCIKKPKHLAVVNAPSRATRKVSKGDVLFSMVRPYLRNIAMVELDSCIASTGFYVCRCSEILDSKYCYYLMLSNYVVEGLNQFMKGDNSPSINNTHIISWIYPIPPLSEQKRISGAIDGLLTYVGNLEGATSGIEKYIDEVKSKLLDLAIHGKLVPQDPSDEPAIELLKRINPDFKPSDNLHYGASVPNGWQLCHIQDIASVELGKTLDRLKNSGKEKPYLCALNVKWDSFDLSTVKTIRIASSEKERYAVKPGDLLVCEGGDVGRSAIWTEHIEIYYQNALHRIRFKSQDICQEFFLYVLRNYKDRGIIDDVCKGVTIKHFTGQVFKSLDLPIPPLKEQMRIVDCVNAYCNILEEIAAGIK